MVFRDPNLSIPIPGLKDFKMGLGLAASGMGMTSFSLGGMVACFRNWAEKLATGGQLEVLKTRSSSKVWDSAKGENKYDIYIICTYTYVCTPAYMHTIAYVHVMPLHSSACNCRKSNSYSATLWAGKWPLRHHRFAKNRSAS